MTLVGRFARFFVAPPAEAEKADAVRWVPPSPAPPASDCAPAACGSVGVVCAPRDARVAGGAAALALARAAGAGTALVVEWTGQDSGPAPRRPASRAARRLAEEAGSGAVASGRLAWVAVAAEEAAAAEQARGILRCAGGPAVLVVAGPRGPAMEELLAESERTILFGRPGDDDSVTALAAQRLGAFGVALPSSPGAAALARAGTALVSPLRRPMLEAVDGR